MSRVLRYKMPTTIPLWTEYTYAETVKVHYGIAVVESNVAVDFLLKMGFEEVPEQEKEAALTTYNRV